MGYAELICGRRRISGRGLRAYTSGVDKPPKQWIRADQQPIGRVIGKRIPPSPGTVPSQATRAAMDANARYRTRAPKGLFFYESHDQMIRDRERWIVEAIVRKQHERA